MTIVMNPKGTWQEVAIFEVAAEDADMAVKDFLVQFEATIDHHRNCQVRPAPESRSGWRWFAARIDFSIGEWRALHLAAALVYELEETQLEGYRLVAGREWIELAKIEKCNDLAALYGIGAR